MATNLNVSTGKRYALAALGIALISAAIASYAVYKGGPVPTSPTCIEVTSTSSSFGCKDAGGFASTCATAKCPAGYTLTGGGGACSAGDRKIKSLFPRFSTGEFTIACEEQGVPPQVTAICCKL